MYSGAKFQDGVSESMEVCTKFSTRQEELHVLSLSICFTLFRLIMGVALTLNDKIVTPPKVDYYHQ